MLYLCILYINRICKYVIIFKQFWCSLVFSVYSLFLELVNTVSERDHLEESKQQVTRAATHPTPPKLQGVALSSLTSYLCLLSCSQWSYFMASRLCSHSHSSLAFSLVERSPPVTLLSCAASEIADAAATTRCSPQFVLTQVVDVERFAPLRHDLLLFLPLGLLLASLCLCLEERHSESEAKPRADCWIGDFKKNFLWYPLEDAAVARTHAAQCNLLLGLILSLPVGVGLLLSHTLGLK